VKLLGMYVIKTLVDIFGRDRLYPNLDLKKLEFKTCVVDISMLFPHEDVDRGTVELIINDIVENGVVKYPVVVDVRTFIILDGHHRVEALKELGYDYVPVFFVDYAKDYVDVYPFRKDLPVSKASVIKKVFLSKEVFPHKTTRHVYKGFTILPTFTKSECLRNPQTNFKTLSISYILCYE
jgi:hypothetical protein